MGIKVKNLRVMGYYEKWERVGKMVEMGVMGTMAAVERRSGSGGLGVEEFGWWIKGWCWVCMREKRKTEE
jgi:hypothetical protein